MEHFSYQFRFLVLSYSCRMSFKVLMMGLCIVVLGRTFNVMPSLLRLEKNVFRIKKTTIKFRHHDTDENLSF